MHPALLLLASCASPQGETGETGGLAGAPIPPSALDALAAGDEAEVLVRVVPGRWPDPLASLKDELARSGTRVTRAYDHFPVVVLRLPDLDAANALSLRPDVLAIEADVGHAPSLTQSLGLIGQPTAAAEGFLGAGTSVAVLDTGADWTTVDLGACTAVGVPAACRVAYAADFATADGSRDDNGHGTNVSAVVAAVAPGTDILALDVFRADGLAYSSDILSAIDWVIANKDTWSIAAINMSLGSGGYTAPCTGVFSSGIASAYAAGVSVAVASGNGTYTNAISSPACVDEAISVGAVYDSSMGSVGWSVCTDASTAADKVTCFSNSASFLDVLAPGALVTAGGYSMGGTSQASPHVAGALAVLRGADPDASIETIEARLLDNGTAVTDARNGLIFPRIDLAAAVSDCVTGVSPSSLSPDAAGASGSIAVSGADGCAWTATSSASWLTLDAAGGTGSASLGWTAAANTGAARTGSLTVAGRTVSAAQTGDAAPTGAIVVAAAATATRTTTVTLALSASDASGGVSSMCISNTTSCTAWQTYATSLGWTLSSGAGSKTVYAWFRDAYGNVSAVTSDTILLDATAPTNGTVTLAGSSGTLAVSWTGFADASSGLASYSLRYGTTAPASACTNGTVGYAGSGTAATLSGLTNGTTYSVRVCALDAAGNTSTGATASLRVAPEYVAPTGTIVLAGGAAWTTGRSVTATLSASDASGVSSACLSTSTTCTAFQAYATSLTASLASRAGTQTVYATFRDAYGNVSAAASDTIGYDATGPSGGTLTASPSDARVSLSWTGLTDATSGLASYKVVYAVTTAPSSCASGTVLYTGTSTSTVATGLTNGSTYGFRVCGVDVAGNTGSGVTTTSRPAPEFTPPTGTIVIAGDAAWTGSRTVSVALTASDASGVSRMCVTTATTCTSWVSFASAMNVTVGSGTGTKTVRAWFEDAYGNRTTTAVSDTIGLDATVPTNGVASATGASGGLSVTWSGFADTSSGLASYKLVHATVRAPSSCATGTVGYTGTATTASLTGLTAGTTTYVRVCAVDAVGNTSTGATASAVPL